MRYTTDNHPHCRVFADGYEIPQCKSFDTETGIVEFYTGVVIKDELVMYQYRASEIHIQMLVETPLGKPQTIQVYPERKENVRVHLKYQK